MIKFLDLNKFVKNLVPVTTTDYFTRDGSFNEAGLFSETIFGAEGTKERKTRISYINLNSNLIHPTALKIMLRLDQKIKKFISAESFFVLDNKGQLKEDPDGVSGIKEFIKIFPDIKFRGETPTRDKFIKLLQKAYKDNTLFISYLPIIPVDYRPHYKDQSGEDVFDALNDKYLTVIRRSLQVKAAVGAGPLYDLLLYGLQNSVLEHDDFIRQKIQKKQGLIRMQMLGKRLDYSGRAVIVPDPKLKINEIGIPFRLAVSLFEPFITYQLLHSGKTNKEELNKAIKEFTGSDLSIENIANTYKAIKHDDIVSSSLYKIFFDATERAMLNRVVLAKRDPVLHDESYRGCIPVLIEGDSVKICSMQVGSFNADFDGDQMAIFHPMSNESQEEIKTKMMRLTSGESATSVTFAISKEMWAGLYMLTKDKGSKNTPIEITTDDMNKVKFPYNLVKYRGVVTTAGKAILNSCFPIDHPFITEQATKKLINGIIFKCIKTYGEDITKQIIFKLESAAFKWATILAPSFTLSNLDIPKNILDLKEKLKNSKNLDESVKIMDEAKKMLKDYLKDSGLGDLVESGSTKGWNQPTQILFAKGIISDPAGNLSEIKGSFSDGLTNTDFFNAAHGARKGIIDRVINTADTGYMSRKLAYLLNTVEVDKNLLDCKTKRTLDLKMDNDLRSRLTGRFVIKDNKLKQFDKDDFKNEDTVKLRSPVFCESPKICHTCYGKLIEKLRSPYVGIYAAQKIGERGTQLIMRTFHTGGAVNIIKKNMIDDIISNDPLLNKSITSKHLDQNESDLITLKKCSIILDLENNYIENDNYIINNDDNKIWVKSLIAKIEYDDTFFNIILDYPCNIEASNMERVKKEYIKISFNENDKILESTMEASEMKGQVLYVERLIGGRELVNDPSHLYRKLLKVYSEHSSMDSVHFEVLVGQVLRYKKDIRYPARLGKTWDPISINMKNVIFSEGFIQGLEFENINNAISQGLIGEDRPEHSVLENLLLGKLAEGKEKKKK